MKFSTTLFLPESPKIPLIFPKLQVNRHCPEL